MFDEQEYMSITSIEESHKQLTYQIQETTEERDSLKLITQNQLKNINELQEKCEESYIAISQLPENRNTASDRYEEAITEITKLQNKQFEINELLNLSLKEFDENMKFITNSKNQLAGEINIANQRLLIYHANLKEIKELSEKNITNLKESINAKSLLVKTVEKHISSLNISHISSQGVLKELNEKKSKISLINNDLRERYMEIEEGVERANEQIQSLEKCMAAEQETLNTKLDSLKMEWETRTYHKQELEQAINAVINNIEHKKNENIALKNKLEEAKMLSKNLKSSLESKYAEFCAMKKEFEVHKMKISYLKNTVNESVQVSINCSEKEAKIQELIEKKDTLSNSCSSLKDKLKTINEKIDNDKLNYNTIKGETEEINNVITSIKAKTVQQQRELDELKKSFEEKINSLSEDIKQQTNYNAKLSESIKGKEEIIDNHTKTLISLKTELDYKKTLFKEKEEQNAASYLEFTTKSKDLKEKRENLLRELQEKKEAINKIKTFNESVKTKHEEIASEKEKYDILTKSYENEKENLKASCNKLLEQNILELQTIRMEKTKQWETVRDTASKAEFTYYTVKSKSQRLKDEMNCLNENLKTYSCENEMLKMLNGWIMMNNDASDTSTIHSKSKEINPGEFPDCSSKSDTSFDEGTENEQNDFVIQKYQMSRVHGQGTIRHEATDYSTSTRPIMISMDTPSQCQVMSDQYGSITLVKNENMNDSSSEEPMPSMFNPPFFPLEQAKKNSERKSVKHKLQDQAFINISSSEDIKTKKAKASQKKVLTKRGSLNTKQKSNVSPKKKTILDMVIDSSN